MVQPFPSTPSFSYTIIKEQLLPNLVSKDTLNSQFREISLSPLKMGGLNIKLPSDHESYLEWSKEKEFFKIVNSNVFAHFVHRQDIKFFIYNKMIKDHV